MHKEVKAKYKNNNELFALITLVILSLLIIYLMFFNINKFKDINLNSAKITTIDDRKIQGSSVTSLLRTNQGIEFTCTLVKSFVEQPFCKLLIEINHPSEITSEKGIDLTSFDKIGLSLTHDHPTQPGTRVELHNFNRAYSDINNQRSLKPNSYEYLEAYVEDPAWLPLNDFSIPQWWHNRYNLSLNNGGTDFSNVLTIALSPSTKVLQGEYKITVKAITFKGAFIGHSALIYTLLFLWSAALGYYVHKINVTKKLKQAEAELAPHTIEFGAITCHLTGALNRIGLRKCFDQIPPTDLHHLSIIIFNIDNFDHIEEKFSPRTVNKILKRFVNKVGDTCRASDNLARWNSEDFLLVCPETSLESAIAVADKLRKNILESSWPKGIHITCSTGVAQMYDEDLNNLIYRAAFALKKAKKNGLNQTEAA